MDTNEPSQTITSEKPSTLTLKQILLYLSVILISVGSTLFVSNLITDTKTTEPNEQATNTIIEGWDPLKSNKKSYPYVDGNTKELYLWDMDTKKLNNTEIKTKGGGGSAGIGNSDAATSPNLFYTAYIDRDEGGLWLISHETYKKKKISPENTKVTYITEWSPDSRYIVYFVKTETLVLEGMGVYSGTVEFKEQKHRGFLAFNIITGETITLSSLAYVETFVDSTKLLVRPTFQSDELVVFDIETFEANFDMLEDTYSFGSHQFDVSSDGKSWTFTYSKNPTDDANIMYGTFPSNNDAMDTLDSGAWAEVQRPLISPDGTKLMYQKKEGYKSPGRPLNEIHIIDVTTRENKVVTEGSVGAWVDDNNIVISRSARKSSPTADIYLVKLSTGKEYFIGAHF